MKILNNIIKLFQGMPEATTSEKLLQALMEQASAHRAYYLCCAKVEELRYLELEEKLNREFQKKLR